MPALAVLATAFAARLAPLLAPPAPPPCAARPDLAAMTARVAPTAPIAPVAPVSAVGTAIPARTDTAAASPAAPAEFGSAPPAGSAPGEPARSTSDAAPVEPRAATGARPAASVMDCSRLSAIDRVFARALSYEGFPGAAVIVGHGDSIVWRRGYGHLDWSESSARVDPSRTMYDLASLTKIVATTTAIMILVDRRDIRLDDPVGKYLPPFRKGLKRKVTIRLLLEHRGGLPAGREIWRVARTPRQARRAVLDTPLEYPPGEGQIYSDLGADVLGFVVEAVTGERLDAFVQRRVFRRLGMTSTMFRPPRVLRPRIAPTEINARRGHALRGEVHDEAAWALGGVAGHAGLFSTAADLSVFARMMLHGGSLRGVRIVRPATVAEFTRRQAGWRALGWITCAGGASCGQHMSERAYGHTGFTGTSLWIDPDRQMFVIVLTNWMHELPDGQTPPWAVLQDVRADVADIAELAAGVDGALPEELRADRAIGWIR